MNHREQTFCVDYNPEHALVVCNVPYKRRLENASGIVLDLVPWREFLDLLWGVLTLCGDKTKYRGRICLNSCFIKAMHPTFH